MTAAEREWLLRGLIDAAEGVEQELSDEEVPLNDETAEAITAITNELNDIMLQAVIDMERKEEGETND